MAHVTDLRLHLEILLVHVSHALPCLHCTAADMCIPQDCVLPNETTSSTFAEVAHNHYTHRTEKTLTAEEGCCRTVKLPEQAPFCTGRQWPVW